MSEPIGLPLKQLKRNFGVIRRNVKGLSTEQSLIPFMDGASTLNWLLGHLVVSRDAVLRVLGAETVWDETAREHYGFGTSATDREKPLDDLVRDLTRSQERLEAALKAATAEQLEAEHKGGAVADFIEFLVWHDSYHAGQTIIYRRLAGLESPIG